MESLRLSDIVKFILLGGIGVLIIGAASLTCLPDSIFDEISDTIFPSPESTTESESSIIDIKSLISNTFMGTVLLAFIYIVGIVLQGLRVSINSAIGHLRCVKEIGNINRRYLSAAEKIKNFAITTIFSFYFFSYENFCLIIRSKPRMGKSMVPGWIYLSQHPSQLTEIIAASVSDPENSDGSDNNNTNKYLNELLTSLSMLLRTLWIAIAIVCIVRLINHDPAYDKAMRIGLALLVAYPVFEIIFSRLARAYAINYLKELHNRCTAKFLSDDSLLRKLMYTQGAPTAYIGIRVAGSDGTYLNHALESIESQRYLNIRVIIVNDCDDACKPKVGRETPREVAAKFSENKGGLLYGRISFIHKSYGGPAGAILALREQIRKAGTNGNDVFIMLDDDDRLHSPEAVYDIMLSMKSNKADICLGCFESVDALGLDITNNGGSTHNSLATKLLEHPRKGCQVDNIYLASSIGWTKSYTLRALTAYDKLFHNKEDRERFIALRTYEDFPDIIALLMRDIVLTGVVEPTHSYYKRKTSITGSPSLYAFAVSRPGFLSLTLKLAHDHASELCDQAIPKVMRFIIFKTIQICNIMAKYYTEASPKSPDLLPFTSVDPFLFFPEALAKTMTDIDHIDTVACQYICDAYRIDSIPDASLLKLIYMAMAKEYQESADDEGNSDKIDVTSLVEYYNHRKKFSATGLDTEVYSLFADVLPIDKCPETY